MSAGARDTIFALSSGSPPAAIAVIRISGPRADVALESLVGGLPAPRRASVATIRDPDSGNVIDRGLMLRFPGPGSATGEDLAELHLHGGRSVVAATLDALAQIEGLRAALPGEFTRRAFENGRIDLAEAEGLADLLEAETEAQRRSALALAGGALSAEIGRWQARLLGLAAEIEALLDFSDEDDVSGALPTEWETGRSALEGELREWLDRPAAERLKEGIRVVIAGPPNAGKSSLLNRLSGREAAITSAVPGTTRDLVEAPTSIGGTAYLLIDTAGMRESGDAIERVGVERARKSLEAADIILWLGAAADKPDAKKSLVVQSRIDVDVPAPADLRVSAVTGEGIDALLAAIGEAAQILLPREGEVALNRRHRALLTEVVGDLEEARADDPLIKAEALRLARKALDRITGHAGVEDMLDSLFGRFCIGK